MAKDKLTDYDSTASGNLDVGGISVAEGMLPSGVNNAIRELMSHQAEAFGAGTPLYVDQTNNRLGINQAAPAHPLHVGTDDLIVDASGNLLVGKTTSTSSTEGTELKPDASTGYVLAATGTSQRVALFNRLTTDGEIVSFRKDGTTVGSIGVWSSSLLVGTGDVGLAFVDGTPERIQPRKADDQTSADALIDLGHTSNRFKDLYLSGGVYLGGASSANYLDDYEEGTWTPVFSNAGTPTYTTQFGRYTKIGRVVYCTVAIYATGVSSGSTIGLNGLPFSSADTGDTSQRITIRIANSGHLNGLSEPTGRFRINGSSMEGVKSDSQTSYMTASQMTTSGTIQFSTDFWYYTS